jgi:hypothetical protein
MFLRSKIDNYGSTMDDSRSIIDDLRDAPKFGKWDISKRRVKNAGARKQRPVI